MERDGEQGRFPRKGEAGSYEWHNKQYYSSIEPEGSRGRIHIQGPSMSFKTSRHPVVVLRAVLHILDNRHFEEVLTYNGPTVELPRQDGGRVLTRDLVLALKTLEGRPSPLWGFRCELAQGKEHDVKARLTVGKRKTRLKIKGAIQRAVWDRIRKDINRKLHLDF